MQQQLCPRCKFRLTGAKAICSTCGYAFSSVRKQPEPSVSPPKPAQRNLNSSPSPSSNTSSLRQVQATVSNQGGGSFWRAFFGLDPLPSDKPDRDEPALGET